MNERMRAHIDMLFEDAPKTRKALELKEELLANSEERYQDLTTSGISPEDAFKNVINSIGNVSELFSGLREFDTTDQRMYEERVRKNALIKSISIGIYIFSIALFISFGLLNVTLNTRIDLSMVGFILMILIDIIPTCMLVYITTMYPNYHKQENTIVEEFKEWKYDSFKLKSVKGSMLSILWTMTLVLYFVISFATHAWKATWILFLVALCLHTIVDLLFRIKELK